MSRIAVTEKIISTKVASGIKWSEVAAKVGLSKEWVTAACLGQMTLNKEQADLIAEIFGLSDEEAKWLIVPPYKGSLATAVPTDPLIYRFYELVNVYGSTFKALIHEEFGDGIMSAIDFKMDMQREHRHERQISSLQAVLTASIQAEERSVMHIAILTFEGYNELDSFIALGVLNRVKKPEWRVSIACPTNKVRSMNGVVIESHATLEEASVADAVVVGSGMRTREIVEDKALMARLKLDPARQLLASQCSGTLVLAKLGLLDGTPACTDLTTKPWVQAAGVDVLNQPFFANGNVATAGGCLASSYLAAWIVARLAGIEEAKDALHYVAPVGEKEEYVERGLRNIRPYLPEVLAVA